MRTNGKEIDFNRLIMAKRHWGVKKRNGYLVLFDRWELRVFENIAESEQRHMDSFLNLLGKYGLEDPALAPGMFDNAELQELYDKLVATGENSIIEALEAGVIIEQTDIEDINNLLDQTIFLKEPYIKSLTIPLCGFYTFRGSAIES
jgi:hypothetical protein